MIVARCDGEGVITHVNEEYLRLQPDDGRDDTVSKTLRFFGSCALPKPFMDQLWTSVNSGSPVSFLDVFRRNSSEVHYVISTIVPISGGYLSFDAILGETLGLDLVGALVSSRNVSEQSSLIPLPEIDNIVHYYSEKGQDGSVSSFGRLLTRRLFEGAREEPGGVKSKLRAALNIMSEIEPILVTVQNGFKQVRGEPVNLRILAGKLENDGNALSTISQNYETMAAEMQKLLTKLHQPKFGVLDALMDTCLDLNYEIFVTSLLERYSDSLLPIEGCGDSLPFPNLKSVSPQVRGERCDVGVMSAAIPDTCRQLMRRINGLDVVKMLCRVESERMRSTDGGLSGIIDRLDAFHVAADKNLRDLSSKSSEMTRILKSISS